MVQPEAGCIQPFLLSAKFHNTVVKFWGKNVANSMIFWENKMKYQKFKKNSKRL
jgi:hypothetical protein